MIEDVVKSLRKIFVPHKIIDGKVVLSGEDAAALAFTLGYGTVRLNESMTSGFGSGVAEFALRCAD